MGKDGYDLVYDLFLIFQHFTTIGGHGRAESDAHSQGFHISAVLQASEHPSKISKIDFSRCLRKCRDRKGLGVCKIALRTAKSTEGGIL